MQLRCLAAGAKLRGHPGARPGRRQFRGSQFYYEIGARPVRRTCVPRRRRPHKPFTLGSRGVAKKFQRGVRVWLREEREQPAGKVKDGGKGFGRLPAERGRARRGVNEHERKVEREREVESAARERDVREAVEREGYER